MRLFLLVALSFGVAHAAPEAPPTSGVRPLAQTQKQKTPNGAARIAHLAEGRNAYVGKLTLAPGFTVPEHADATEEYLHILQGGGTITIDGKAQPVKAGDTIYMAAGATVSFVNGPEPLVAIQVFAGPAPAKKYANWAADK